MRSLANRHNIKQRKWAQISARTYLATCFRYHRACWITTKRTRSCYRLRFHAGPPTRASRCHAPQRATLYRACVTCKRAIRQLNGLSTLRALFAITRLRRLAAWRSRARVLNSRHSAWARAWRHLLTPCAETWHRLNKAHETIVIS